MKDKKDSKQKRGVYFALAVCAAGIAIAGASTYTSVMDSISDETLSAKKSTISHEYSAEESPEENPGTAAAENEPEPEKVNAPAEQANADAGTEENTAEDIDSTEDEEDIAGEEPASDNAAEEEDDTAEAEEDIEETAAEPTASYDVSDTLRFPLQDAEIIGAYDQNLKLNPVMKDHRTHNGIDIKAKVSQAVSAIGNGKVISVRHDLLLGNIIEIEHGDYTALYCGLGDTFLVNEGDVVAAGADIGSVYGLPLESDMEPHLHLEIFKDGVHVDPAEVLNP